MPIAVVASVYDCHAAGGYGADSSPIDTTGADLLVAVLTWINGVTPDFYDGVDVNENTWTPLTPRTEGVLGAQVGIWYCLDPFVGPGHVFSYSSASPSYTTVRVRAYSGVDSFDKETGAAASQPGSATPTNNGALVVGGGVNLFADDYAITQLTMRDQAGDIGSETVGGFYADEIQTTATARNPQQSNPGGGGWPSYASVMAIFNPTASGGTTATVASLLDEVKAALNVNQRDLTTVSPTLDEVQAVLNLNQSDLVTVGSTLDEVQASLNVNQTSLTTDVTVAASLDETQAALNVVEFPQTTIQALLDEASAALNVNQTDLVTVTTTLDEVQASLNIVQRYDVTIGTTLDEVVASLSAYHANLMTIDTDIDEVQASLAVNQSDYLTINALIDEVAAGLNVNAFPNINIATVLDEVQAALSVQQPFRITIGATLDEVSAALQLTMLPKLTISSTLDEVTFSGSLYVIIALIDKIGGKPELLGDRLRIELLGRARSVEILSDRMEVERL